MNGSYEIRNKIQVSKRVIIFTVILLLLVFVIVFLVPQVKLYLIERKLNQRIETQHFSFFFNKQDMQSVNGLKDTLESNFDKVTKDLNYTLNEKITVKVYPSLKEFHIAVGRPDAPDWFRGYGDNDKINIVSPLHMGDISAESVVMHEFTHIITRKINTNIPLWIYEGIASYEGKEMSVDYIKESISKDLSDNNVPTFKELCTDYKTFGENNSYQFSYTAVEFIINEYGFEALNSIIRSSGDFQKELGTTESELYEKWITYLKKNYL